MNDEFQKKKKKGEGRKKKGKKTKKRKKWYEGNFINYTLVAKNFVNVTRFLEAIIVKGCQKEKNKKRKENNSTMIEI